MESAEFYLTQGFNFQKDGNFEQALVAFNNSIKLNPINEFCLIGRGGILFLLQQYSLAIEDFTKAISINSEFVFAYINALRLIAMGLLKPACAYEVKQ